MHTKFKPLFYSITEALPLNQQGCQLRYWFDENLTVVRLGSAEERSRCARERLLRRWLFEFGSL